MEYIAVVIVSVGVSIITSHIVACIQSRKHLEIADQFVKDSMDDFKKICTEVIKASRK